MMTEQEPDPPDPMAAIHAAIRLLWDVVDRLPDGDDLALRAMALRAAMVRIEARP